MSTKKALLAIMGGAALLAWVGVSFAYETAPVDDGGTITGKIKFTGKAPEPKHFTVQKNPDVCGQTRDLQEVPVKDGALVHAVVFIEGVQKGKAFEEKGTPVMKKGCELFPYVNVQVKNANVQIENQDPVMHNPHLYEVVGTARITVFNIGLPEKGSKLAEPLKLKRNGKLVKFECDQHDFMHAWAYVIENPYYSLLTDGTYKIEGVPPGTYKLKVWAPVIGFKEADVTVPAKGSVTMDFEFTGA
jgi:hypothetical protein